MREARDSSFGNYEADMQMVIDHNGRRFADALAVQSSEFPLSSVYVGNGQHVDAQALVVPYEGTSTETARGEERDVRYAGEAVLEPGGRITVLPEDRDHPPIWDSRRRPSLEEYPIIHKALEGHSSIQEGLQEQARIAQETIKANGATEGTQSTGIVETGIGITVKEDASPVTKPSRADRVFRLYQPNQKSA